MPNTLCRGAWTYSRSKQRLDIQQAQHLVTMSLVNFVTVLLFGLVKLCLECSKKHNMVWLLRPIDLGIYTLENCSH